MEDRISRLENEIASLWEEVSRLRARLQGVFPGVEELLARRGIVYIGEDNRRQLVLPSGEDKIDIFYRLMRKYSFRIFLRDLIGRSRGFSARQKWKYVSQAVVRRYIDELSALEVIEEKEKDVYCLPGVEVTSFGETLEWFVAEVLSRELRLQARRGLKPLGLAVGGDFDILAAAGESLVYLEVKSSPPKHIEQKEVDAFIRRRRALKPEASLFLVDTQLRMRDKLVPMLKEALDPPTSGSLERLKDGVYLFPGALCLANSKPSLIKNIRFFFEEMYRRETLL